MSHRSSPSATARWFRPFLETLEERNLLLFAPVTGILDLMSKNIFTLVQQSNQLKATVDADVKAFNGAPHDSGALIKLELDSALFLEQTTQLQLLTSTFSTLLKFGEQNGMVTNDVTIPGLATTQPGTTDITALDARNNEAQKVLAGAQAAEGIVVHNMLVALQSFLNGSPPSLSTPSSQTTQTEQSNGTVSETINKAPETASQAAGSVSQSVTANNPSNSDVVVKETYSATDGTFASASDDCTNGTITVPLTVPASGPGVVGTWTTSVTGLPDQTNTTTWTA